MPVILEQKIDSMRVNIFDINIDVRIIKSATSSRKILDVAEKIIN